MNFFTLSDKGKVRAYNEDYTESFRFSWCGSYGAQMSLTSLILADGMGGAAAGGCASRIAVSELKKGIVDFVFFTDPADILNVDKSVVLEKTFQKANSIILKESLDNEELRGMGTTLIGCIIEKNTMHLANVGDSRCYSYFNGNFSLLSKDHSLVQELIDNETITESEAFTHPKRNVITRVIGIKKAVEVDIKKHQVQHGELILMCSDGLSGYVEKDSIKKTIADHYNLTHTNLPQLAERLIIQACSRGGGDNISVALYQHPYASNK